MQTLPADVPLTKRWYVERRWRRRADEEQSRIFPGSRFEEALL